ncbi:MAG: class I SAM-dependent methyltransferase [Candidatus Pacearchaeota archaeon]|jgi:ubiquinone/menaquinone biosynthesis C-methylase UbiE
MNKEAKLTLKIYSKDTKREWNRLVRDPYHKLEFDTTMRFLKKYLPKKGLILDAGGGPGRYSIELANLGYDVVLLDFVPANLELANKMIKKHKVVNKIKDVLQGSITDLSKYKDNTFDAVLCLGGPLSHVHPESERKKAVNELTRVAKKNAPIFISVMGKFGVLMCGPVRWVNEIELNSFEKFSLFGDDYLWHGGQAFAHYFELEELKNLFDKNKVNFVENVGLEGLATTCQEAINKMAGYHKKAWKNWLQAHERLCTHPTVVDSSMHFMVIARKK